MQASKKPVEEISLQQLQTAGALVTIQSMSAQPMNRKRVIIEGTPAESASKLLDLLSKEGVVHR
jgi:electron transfer flavoprotein alpha/beta subunit